MDVVSAKKNNWRPSYNSLKESLRCANQEAKGYLERVVNQRQEIDRLQKLVATREHADFLVRVLALALYEAQNTPRIVGEAGKGERSGF